jgi:hypothetical protein
MGPRSSIGVHRPTILRFTPADYEPVEREVGQIGGAQKAAGEVGGGIDRFWLGAWAPFPFYL